MIDFKSLDLFYREHLLNQVLPFYLNHALDPEFGGYANCLDNAGRRLSTDKYLWSQGRGTWTFSAVYNRVAREDKYLDAARLGARFIERFGRDERGYYVFYTSREGRNIGPSNSIYADLFVVLGLTELFRATGDTKALAQAYAVFRQAWTRIQDPNFDAAYPGGKLPGASVHGVPMILLDVAQELARTVADETVDAAVAWCVETITQRHYQPDYGMIFEQVTPDGKRIDLPAGRVINPGHAIECAWFMMHHAHRAGWRDLLEWAGKILFKALELGWDKEYGGILLAIDADTGRPSDAFPHADYKPWWPETEALYALILAHELLGSPQAQGWYDRVHDWSMNHLVSPQGDWYQRMDRQGRPIDTVIGLPVKDPYHLPRALILGYQSLRRVQGNPTPHDPFDILPKVPAPQMDA